MTEEKLKPLNKKQEQFCHEYLIDKNATQAAIRAGYSQKTAYSQGHDLLKKPEIKTRIDKLYQEQVERLKMSADEVLIELANIAKGNIKDFLAFKTEKTQVGIDEETGQPIFDYKQVVDVKPSDEIDGRLIQEVSIGKDGTFKFKLYDKKGALESLGRVHKLFVDKVESESNNNHNMAISIDFGIPRPPKEAAEAIENEQTEKQDQGEIMNQGE